MPGGAEEGMEVEMLPLVLSLAPCGGVGCCPRRRCRGIGGGRARSRDRRRQDWTGVFFFRWLARINSLQRDVDDTRCARVFDKAGPEKNHAWEIIHPETKVRPWLEAYQYAQHVLFVLMGQCSHFGYWIHLGIFFCSPQTPPPPTDSPRCSPPLTTSRTRQSRSMMAPS